MLESRSHSRNDQDAYDFRDPRNARTPYSNVSESLLEQQMHLMNEMFRMMSAQHEQLRGRSNNMQNLKVKPEKFSEVSELRFIRSSPNSRTVVKSTNGANKKKF